MSQIYSQSFKEKRTGVGAEGVKGWEASREGSQQTKMGQNVNNW